MVNSSTKNAIMNVIKVISGNFLEMYDFLIYGFFAKEIGLNFFPSSNPDNSLLSALATFAVAYIMRPVGALVLGSYADKYGRKKGLVLTLSIMSLGTVLIALTPSYNTIGILAPILVLLGRVLQGFSAGAELGGVSIYLSEIAKPHNKGFYVSFQSFSIQLAIMFASALAVLLHIYIPKEDMITWGWRIPFLIGCSIIPVLFIIRKTLSETPAFLKMKHTPSLKEVFRSIKENQKIVLLSTLMVAISNVIFYFITVYSKTFGEKTLHLSEINIYLVTFFVGLSNFILLPIMGLLNDKFGRKGFLLVTAFVTLVASYPLMNWLIDNPTYYNMLIINFIFSVFYASYNAAMMVALTEVMPAQVKATGFSLSYSLSQSLFGGFTPLILTYLKTRTGIEFGGIWLSLVALISFVACLLIFAQQASNRKN